LLSILSMAGGKVSYATLPLSNSVTAAPEILALARDGRTAFVVERLGERKEQATTLRDLPPGQRVFAVDLSDRTAPRLADEAAVAAFPEALALHPDGRHVAVVSNTSEASSIQIVAYENGRFGPVRRFDMRDLGIAGTGSGPRGGVTATNVHWHPSGRFLAVNINTQNRIAFFEMVQIDGKPVLQPWGNAVEVGPDPFVGRFTPDGRFYLTSDWGRDLAAADLAGRVPDRPSAISVIRLADPAAPRNAARHERIGGAATDVAAEGLAVSPDGRLVATVNMRSTAFPPASSRFQRAATISLLTFERQSGALAKLADYRFEGVLPEGGTFDLTGDHFLATVFQGHDGAAPDAGPGLEVFRVMKGETPGLRRLGRIPLPHGVHHVAIAP
ncbi:MAG: lactonase family protein, partial [Alphaproteobacteria bacterium]